MNKGRGWQGRRKRRDEGRRVVAGMIIGMGRQGRRREWSK
jgi:hypothetical protein